MSYDTLFESVKAAPLLVLDDFGEVSATPWAKEKLYQILNYRYNGRLPTVITTRLTLDEIKEYYDRSVASRLAEQRNNMRIQIDLPDYRPGDISETKPQPKPLKPFPTRTRRRATRD